MNRQSKTRVRWFVVLSPVVVAFYVLLAAFHSFIVIVPPSAFYLCGFAFGVVVTRVVEAVVVTDTEMEEFVKYHDLSSHHSHH